MPSLRCVLLVQDMEGLLAQGRVQAGHADGGGSRRFWGGPEGVAGGHAGRLGCLQSHLGCPGHHLALQAVQPCVHLLRYACSPASGQPCLLLESVGHRDGWWLGDRQPAVSLMAACRAVDMHHRSCMRCHWCSDTASLTEYLSFQEVSPAKGCLLGAANILQDAHQPSLIPARPCAAGGPQRHQRAAL